MLLRTLKVTLISIFLPSTMSLSLLSSIWGNDNEHKEGRSRAI